MATQVKEQKLAAEAAAEIEAKAAEAAAMVSAAGSGLFDSVFGALGDRYIGTAATGGQGAVKAAARGTIQELPTEAMQSAGERFSENLGIRNFAADQRKLETQLAAKLG